MIGGRYYLLMQIKCKSFCRNNHGYVIDRSVVSEFLSNVYDSGHFGEEFKTALSDLSFILLSSYPANHIGFVEDVEDDAHINRQIAPVQEVIINNNKRNKNNKITNIVP